MAPTLPYELVSSIIAEVIGSYVHLRIMVHDGQHWGTPEWDAFANLATVSTTFLEITRRLGSIAFGPYSSPAERYASLF
jgi:hypothetical protein